MTGESDSLHGLSCPNCGGMVPIPEGQIIVPCPFCNLRSMVRGARGLQRYQVPRRIERDQAMESMRRFLSSHRAIAGDAARNARLTESFLAYLPFWTGWARILAWVFGQKRVGSSDHKRYEAREIRVVQEMTWNGAACDVSEFGVAEVTLADRPVEPFDANQLHADGMVFEPVGSESDARQSAEQSYQKRVQDSAKLDRVGQSFLRFIRKRLGLVYYPLWVLRYLYRGRSYQVVVDGHSGQALYGKAPGNTLYRAAVLIGGAAVGALMAIDLSAIAFWLGLQSNDDTAAALLGGGALLLLGGFGVMAAAYRAFRYGEEFEYRPGQKLFSLSPQTIISQVKDVETWIDRLS